jgi:hypothetical protein
MVHQQGSSKSVLVRELHCYLQGPWSQEAAQVLRHPSGHCLPSLASNLEGEVVLEASSL